MSDIQNNHINVLGCKIAVKNLQTATEAVSATIAPENNKCQYICVTGVHGVMESQRNKAIMDIHNNALMCVPDGMPMVWLGRYHGNKEMGRVYGPDLMLEVLSISEKEGFTHFFYGGNEGVADELKIKMVERFPGLKVIGTYCPPFRPLNQEEEAGILKEINNLKPDIIWVGLSTPKQELHMAAWHNKVKAKLMIGVGAAFDFHTGKVKQAPGWIQKMGMEWCFRLCMEPRRLWKRYLSNNPSFLCKTLLQLTGIRKYTIDEG